MDTIKSGYSKADREYHKTAIKVNNAKNDLIINLECLDMQQKKDPKNWGYAGNLHYVLCNTQVMNLFLTGSKKPLMEITKSEYINRAEGNYHETIINVDNAIDDLRTNLEYLNVQQKACPENWGFTGDLKHILCSLKVINVFLNKKPSFQSFS